MQKLSMPFSSYHSVTYIVVTNWELVNLFLIFYHFYRMSIRNINHRIIWIKNIIFSLAVFVLHLFCYKPLSFIRSDFWYRNQIGAWQWPDMWYPTILKKCRKKSVATSMMITTLCSFLLFNSFCWTHWCKYHFSYCSCLPSKHYI